MRFITTELEGVLIIEPDVHRDERGFFVETYQRRKYQAGGVPLDFVQDNHSKSVKGTLRGLHAQLQKPQGKLIRVVQGEIWDVAADVRVGSPTFGRWVGVTLSAENFRQIYVPPGFAHGFLVVSDLAEVEYKVSDYYNPGDELGLAWNDPDLAIAWPVKDPILSEKDAKGKTLGELTAVLPKFQGKGGA